MLCIGETYNERRESLMYGMSMSRRIIKNLKEAAAKWPDAPFQEAVAAEQGWLMRDLRSLRELERWRQAQGLEKDQPWRPKSTPEGAALAKSQQIDIEGLLKALDGK